jgi:transcriptional regulator with XRE-family HTH domain
MNIGERLTYYIEKQGFSKKEFCEVFSFDYNSFVMILANKRNIGINIIQKVHESLPKLNIHWMLYGEGPIETNNTAESILNEPAEEYKLQKDPFEYMLLKYLDNSNVKSKLNEIIQKQIEKK